MQDKIKQSKTKLEYYGTEPILIFSKGYNVAETAPPENNEGVNA